MLENLFRTARRASYTLNLWTKQSSALISKYGRVHPP